MKLINPNKLAEQKMKVQSDQTLMDVLNHFTKKELADWENWKNAVLRATAEEAHNRNLIG